MAPYALDGETAWFNDEVKTAFAASDELVLETVVPKGPLAPAVKAFTMSSHEGVTNLAVTPAASFLATTRLAISAGRARGMKVDHGADMILRRAAEASGKAIEGLRPSPIRSACSAHARATAQPDSAQNRHAREIFHIGWASSRLEPRGSRHLRGVARADAGQFAGNYDVC